MKTVSYFLISLILLASCQTVSAQPNPSISKKYSNTEIEKLIIDYKTSHSHDVMPDAALQQQFQKDFPNSRDIDWEIASNIYEVEFEIGRTDYKAFYDKDANLLAYSLEIRESHLPAIVKNAVITKYPDSRIEDIKKIVQGTETMYKIEVEKGKMDWKVIFNSNGTFIKEIID